ncbi:hypothetical protein PMAYCL1PPCAC_26107 [Pristionchus mayeri]|uniref:ShKT domain-containing protein n=1 Tax=Pristionchus mayeri TaxID=1317129 RepID=A0AAN5D556_9BILA|nr:hypothetical protein PMAYCL1PPCAC_26107 [Pristionchus mayeri]
MFVRLLLLVSLPMAAIATTYPASQCKNFYNKCAPEQEHCTTLFPPQQDGSPNAMCLDKTYDWATDQCRQTCQTCCTLDCKDGNNNCPSWKVSQDFCTVSDANPLDRIWTFCAKTCELCNW